jgi:hypothetical protein
MCTIETCFEYENIIFPGFCRGKKTEFYGFFFTENVSSPTVFGIIFSQ